MSSILQSRMKKLIKIKTLIGSRRFWAGVIGVVVVIMNDALGIPKEQAQNVLWPIVAFILGDSLRKTE